MNHSIRPAYRPEPVRIFTHEDITVYLSESYAVAVKGKFSEDAVLCYMPTTALLGAYALYSGIGKLEYKEYFNVEKAVHWMSLDVKESVT